MQAHQDASAAEYATIDPGSPRTPHRPQSPLLRDWIERRLALKIDVSPTTLAEYTRLLHHDKLIIAVTKQVTTANQVRCLPSKNSGSFFPSQSLGQMVDEAVFAMTARHIGSWPSALGGLLEDNAATLADTAEKLSGLDESAVSIDPAAASPRQVRDGQSRNDI